MPCARCGSPLSAAARCGTCDVRAGETGVMQAAVVQWWITEQLGDPLRAQLLPLGGGQVGSWDANGSPA